ncbi:MAG: hypothetical protein AB7O38_14865 [Pirellulaceae bacterium]
MNWRKWHRTMVREFQRSPGKSLLLVAMLPIAAYFVGPLVWKSLPSARGSVSPATVTKALVAASPFVPCLDGDTASKSSSPASWHELREWMQQDRRMRSAPFQGLRDPFRAVAAVASPTEVADAEEERTEASGKDTPLSELKPDLSPEELGLHLTATIIGKRIRMATINGKPYRERATIDVSAENRRRDDDSLPSASFVLKSVQRKSVTLERNGALYELELAK